MNKMFTVIGVMAVVGMFAPMIGVTSADEEEHTAEYFLNTPPTHNLRMGVSATKQGHYFLCFKVQDLRYSGDGVEDGHACYELSSFMATITDLFVEVKSRVDASDSI